MPDETALFACCGSSRWVREMLARAPFSSREELHAAAEQVWNKLDEQDWLEAFSQHPRIGQNSNSQWSRQEQSGMARASEAHAQEMARMNEEYFAKFGFIFVICATGKTAEQMSSALRARIQNAPAEELRIAAAEQAQIMHLRLDKLLNQ
jgi:2-oxo-4-hydroxy-4-carboxy-5-ureidoimidazoline decarboxylase